MTGIIYSPNTNYVFFYPNEKLFSWPGEFKLQKSESGFSKDGEDLFIGPVEFTSWAD